MTAAWPEGDCMRGSISSVACCSAAVLLDPYAVGQRLGGIKQSALREYSQR